MIRDDSRQMQDGSVLWVVLLGYAFFIGTLSALVHLAQTSRNAQDSRIHARLLQAREALIARAVLDDNRPGSLPCPDRITNSDALNNHPGDGRADMLAGNHCPDYLGWLPWQTLDLPELADDTGNLLWYALAPELRDDDSVQPLDAEVSPGLRLDSQERIAAIIIAAGAPRTGQLRPSAHPADHIESQVAPGSFTSHANGNDHLLAISRDELMAAVGKRVAAEVRRCIEAHAADSGPHLYPWPAPIGSPERRGLSGTLFGRIPTSQPGSGAQRLLNGNARQLEQGAEQLQTAVTADEQNRQLQTLEHAAFGGAGLADELYRIDSRFVGKSSYGISALLTLDEHIALATENGRISRSEGGSIRTDTDNTLALLDTLPADLHALGYDPYLWALNERLAALAVAENPETLLAQAGAVQHLLTQTRISRGDLADALAASQLAAAQSVERALDAQSHPGDSTRLSLAQGSRDELAATAGQFAAKIAAARISLLSGELAYIPDFLDNTALQAQPIQPLELKRSITAIREHVAQLETGLADITALRAGLLTALTQLEDQCHSSSETPAMRPMLREATLRSRSLVSALGEQEAIDDNIAATSLAAAINAFRSAGGDFARSDTAEPRPTQSALVAPSRALAASAEDLRFWLEIIASNARQGALRARTESDAHGEIPKVPETASDSSFFQANRLSEDIGQARRLLSTTASPTQIRTALDRVVASATELARRQRNLADIQTSSRATAFPMIWNSPFCNFLSPTAGSTWWHANRWERLVFYQISSPQQQLPGRIRINGNAGHRLVSIAAGPPVAGQTSRTSHIADYLENLNASPSREGEARTPSPDFVSAPSSSSFNDRLSY